MSRTTYLCVLVVLGVVVPASAEADVRIAVLVGNNVGAPGEEPLRFAETDAQRMRDLLVELGGVERRRAYLLQGSNRERLRQQLLEVRGRARELAEQGQEVTLLFYYSGHGDAASLRLGGSTVGREELLTWLEELPASLRIVVLDTCSTEPSRTRGVRRGEGFDVYVDDQAVARGTIILASSRAGEPAQESDLLGGAVFTHFLLSGMRGAADRDRDGRVTVAEAYAHAYRRTVLRSATGAPAVQHPAFEHDVSGSGDIVLTEPSRSTAALVLPAARDVWYLIYRLPSGSVLAEVGSSASRPVRLAVPPGRLLVQRRRGSGYGVTEVDVQRGGVREVSSDEFRVVPYEEIALRGGRFDLHPTSLGVAGTLRVEGLPGGPVLLGGPLVTVSHRLSRYLIGARVGVEMTSYEAIRYEVFELDLRTDLLAGLWFQAGRMTISLRIGPRLVVLYQSLLRQPAERLEVVGVETETTRWSWGIGGVLSLGLGVPLGRGVGLSISLDGSVMGMPLADGDEIEWGAVPGGGVALGLTWAP